MKKIFIKFGIIIIFSFSFIYSNNNIKVFKEYNDIMEKIKMNKKIIIKKIEPIINGELYRAGRNGLILDINESYNLMRKDGIYNENLLVYKKDYIRNNTFKNRDKIIIGGNKYDKKISIIILIKNNDYIRNLDNITVFANEKWIKRNKINVNGVYKFNNIKTITNYINDKFCLYIDKSKFNKCYLEGFYTIKEKIIYKDYLLNVKRNISNGKIFIFNENNELYEELNVIYTYVRNKGYEIVSIKDLLNG